MPPTTPTVNLRRAALLTTSSSLLVPIAGIVTAPLLARALGPDGRGELAAAMAPAVLMLAVATLGLPEALTYHLARRPWVSRRAIALASGLTVVLGLLLAGLVHVGRDFLSGGDPELADLILLAALITVPALLSNVLRGAASGHQLWLRVAADRVVVTVWRLGLFIALFATGQLTVLSGVLVNATAPFAAVVLVYLPLVWRAFPVGPDGPEPSGPRHLDRERILRPLVTFGVSAWFGSIALMLLARTGDLLMVPLASATDLGLYAVAVTIADVPVLAAFAIQSALFGVSSRDPNLDRLTQAARLTLLIGFLGCGALAAATPFFLVPLFGAGFEDAVLPSLLLILRAFLAIPGQMAASGLAAWGRPGLRSAAFGGTFVVNLAGFVALVPLFGVLGACVAGLISVAVMNTLMLVLASRVTGARVTAFWLVRVADVSRLRRELGRLAHRLRHRRRSSS